MDSTVILDERQARALCEDIPIEDIIIGDRRAINDEKVKALAESIKDIGLQHPIGVKVDYGLIHGRHRIEAYKLLGWATIPAMIHSLDDLHAELAEVDENIQRHPLSALEEGQALKRRKEIYEALHPETKKGAQGGRGGKKNESDNLSFSKDTAAKTGKSERTVQRQVAVAENLDESVQEELKDTPIANNQSELERISKLPKDEQPAAARVAKSKRRRYLGPPLRREVRSALGIHSITKDHEQLRILARLVPADQMTIVSTLQSTAAKTVAEAIALAEGPLEGGTLKVVIAKSAINDLSERVLDDPSQWKRLINLPAPEQRRIAKMIKKGEAQTVFEAMGEAVSGAESLDTRKDRVTKTLERLAREITGMNKQAAKLGWPHLDERLDILLSQLKTAAGTVRVSKPAGPCSYCRGTGRKGSGDCKPCIGSGLLTAVQLASAPQPQEAAS